MNNSFWKTNVGKTLVAAVYLGVSSALTLLVTAIEGDPALFGSWTPVINIGLVFVVKTFADKSTKNL